MRRPVIDITTDGMGFWHIEVKLPKQIYQELDEDEELVDKEELPDVAVFPYATHVIASMGAGGKRPRVRYKPITAPYNSFEEIIFAEWDWVLFWEGVSQL